MADIPAAREGAHAQGRQILRQNHGLRLGAREHGLSGDVGAHRNGDGTESGVPEDVVVIVGGGALKGAGAGLVEGPHTHISDAAGQLHVLQLGAVPEGVGVDLDQGLGKHHRLQILAVLKGAGVDGRDALGNGHGGEGAITLKGPVADDHGVVFADDRRDLHH